MEIYKLQCKTTKHTNISPSSSSSKSSSTEYKITPTKDISSRGTEKKIFDNVIGLGLNSDLIFYNLSEISTIMSFVLLKDKEKCPKSFPMNR